MNALLKDVIIDKKEYFGDNEILSLKEFIDNNSTPDLEKKLSNINSKLELLKKKAPR